MGGSIKLKKGVVPHKFDCHQINKTPSSAKRRVRVGRKRKVCTEPNMDTTGATSTATTAPIEWVDCGAASLSDTECIPEV